MAHIQNVWDNDSITNRQARQDCCGCTACEQVCGKAAITMREDQEGFLYPVVDEGKCVDCGLCTKVCPVINKCESNESYKKSFAGYSTNERIINSCASGGVATALAIETIRQGGVVFGVRYDEKYSASEYCAVRTEEELWNLCSSKYIQPDKSGVFKQVKEELQNGTRVLFVGCPCDVAALNRILRKQYDNLLTCELFCAGVTSHRVLEDYKSLREMKVGSRMVALNVRNKEKGWLVQHIKEEFSNGKVFYKNHFGTYLGYGFLTFRRPSCYHCQYKQDATYCDIKVGDFWGIKDSDPFWNPKGVSVILAKTDKGIAALEELSEFNLYEVEHTIATINNGGFMGLPGTILEKRREIFEDVYIQHKCGLAAACKNTAPWSFWVKYYVPSSFHVFMKKIYHSIKDKKK